MPYAKRHTTPTTAQETEGALIVGYWVAHQPEMSGICQRHGNILAMLDQQEEQRAKQQTVETQTPSSYPYTNLLYTTPVTPSSNQGFQLGPGPLTNENTITAPPPLPVPSDPSAPYRQAGTVENSIINIAPPFTAKPGTVEGAIEAAAMPPVEGAKVTHPCPLCGKLVVTGDVHAC
jgi:hypothetical protein